MTDATFSTGLGGDLIETWTAVFRRQKAFAEHAMGQLDDEGFFWTPAPGLNSVGVITRHLAGNMLSRWTDFLTTDGEKPSRDRDSEFETPEGASAQTRASIMQAWEQGWGVLLRTLDGLTPEDLSRTVTIRGAPHAVHGAVARQLDHYAFHVGQINVVARLRVGSDAWSWFTLAPGGTKAFNEAMRKKSGF